MSGVPEVPPPQQAPLASSGTSRAAVARTMAASLLRAGVPPLIGVLTLPVILRGVSLSDYGLWATLTGIVALWGVVTAGIATEVTRKVAHARGEQDMAEVVEVGRQGVAAVIVLAAVSLPVTAIAGVPLMHVVAPAGMFATGMQLWIALMFYQVAAWFGAAQAAVVVGLQRGELPNSINAAAAVLGAVVTVGLVILGWGVDALLIGMIVMGLTSAVCQMVVTRHLTGTALIWLPRRTRGLTAMLLAGVALGSMQISLLVEPAFAKVVLSACCGSESAAAVQLGYTVTRLGLVAVLAPTTTILVAVAEWRERQPERIPNLVRQAAFVSMGLVCVIAATLLMSGPYLAEAWLGTSVPGIGIAIRGLALVSVVTIISWLFTQTLLGHGNTRGVSIRLAIGSVTAMALMIPVASQFGLAGVIACSFGGALLTAVLLSTIDSAYSRIIWTASASIAPAMVALGLAGAVVIDRIDPGTRASSAVATMVAGLAAAVVGWLLLPRGTRRMMRVTVAERFLRRAG